MAIGAKRRIHAPRDPKGQGGCSAAHGDGSHRVGVQPDTGSRGAQEGRRERLNKAPTSAVLACMGTNYGAPIDGVIDNLPALSRKDLLKLAFAVLDQADVTPRLLSLAVGQSMSPRRRSCYSGWDAVLYELGESP